MQDVLNSNYVKPDNIVINSYLLNNNKSPLVNFVLKDEFMNFRKMYDKKNLIGYQRI